MADLQKEIMQVLKQICDAFESRDYQKCVSFYDPEVVVIPGAEDMITGRDGVVETFKKMERDFARLVMTKVDMVTKMGDEYAVSNGYADALDASGNVVEKFKSVAIWKKVDGHWCVLREMYVTSQK